jgi:gluconolactonase
MSLEDDDHRVSDQTAGQRLRRRAFLRRMGAVGVHAAVIVRLLEDGAPGVAAATGEMAPASLVARQNPATPSPMPSTRMAAAVEVLIAGYDSPEGPAFDKAGNLFFVSRSTGSIVKLTPDGKAAEFFNTGGTPVGLAFHPDGSLYVADEGERTHGILRITPDAKESILVNEYEGRPLLGSNDLCFDRNGVLYFSDPGNSWTDNPIGGFYRLFPNGKLEQIDTGFALPNGVEVTADGTAVILSETGTNQLFRYAINSDGTMGPRQPWATLDPVGLGPDGLAFDVNGDLYVAHYGAGHIDVFDPEAKHVDRIPVPGANPTNFAFGGADNKTLVITEDATASLYRVRLTVAGQPLHDGRT